MPLDGINAVNNPSFENPELAREIEQDNLEYKKEQESATPEKTEELKKSIMESLYGPKKNEIKPEASNDSLKETDNTEIINQDIKKVQETQEFPIIKNIIENNGIVFEPDFYELSIDNGKINVDLLSVENDIKEEIKGLINNLSEDNRESNKSELVKQISNLDDFNGLDTSLDSDGNFKTDILNVIGKFYIDIPDNDLNENISLAIDLVKNDILTNVKNINRNTKTFEKCIEKIESGDLEEMISGIETLNNLAYSGEGKFAKKKLESVKDKEKNKLIAEANEIDAEYKLAQENNNKTLIKKLLAQMEDIKSQASELSSGEVFSAGVIDKMTDNINEGKEAA